MKRNFHKPITVGAAAGAEKKDVTALLQPGSGADVTGPDQTRPALKIPECHPTLYKRH